MPRASPSGTLPAAPRVFALPSSHSGERVLASPRIAGEARVSSVPLPPRGRHRSPPVPPVHPTSGGQPPTATPQQAAARCRPEWVALSRHDAPREARHPRSPSDITLPWRGHWERKTPFPHWRGRRTSHAARGPDSSLLLSRMRGVTRPRTWRWGAGTTSPPAITSGARISPSLSETSFPAPHGGRRRTRPCEEATGAPDPLPRRRTPTLRPSRSSPPEAGPKPGRAAAPHSAPCAILSPPSRPPPPRGSGANTRGRASKQ